MTKRIIALLLTLALLMTVVSGTLVVFAVSEPGTTDGTEPSSTSVETTDGTEPDGTASVETTDGTVPEGTSSVETTDGTVPEGTSSVETTGEATEPPQLPPQMAPILSPTIGALGALIPSLDMMNAATRAASNPLDGMTPLESFMGNRAFYLILNQEEITQEVTKPVVMGEVESGAYKSGEANKEIITSTRVLDEPELTKWLLEPTNGKIDSEFYYVKSLTGDSNGQYMKFNDGSASLSAEQVATKVYGYVKHCSNDRYLTVFALVQTGSDGKEYVLRQSEDNTTFKGYDVANAGAAMIRDDSKSLFMMKEAHYEADFGEIKEVESTQVDATINLFNYDSTIHEFTGEGGLKFYHDEDEYTKIMSNFNEDMLLAVDGKLPMQYEGADAAPKMKPVLDGDGYPQADNPDNDIGKLFDPDNVYIKGRMHNGGGLFRSDNGYYEYNSRKNAAWYNEKENKFVLYNAVISPPYTPSHYLNINNVSHDDRFYKIDRGTGIQNITGDVESGNFLPFNQVTEDTAFKVGTVQESPFGIPRYSLRPKEANVDLWFGMSVEFEFIMPDGKIDDVPMVFEFYGDDDVWVYIDDVLILDMGGVHYAMEGKIDFTNGKLKDPTRGSNEWKDKTLGQLLIANGKGEGVDGDTLKPGTKHTLKLFYLERGGNVSHCKIRFNIPPTPTYDLKITKEGIDENLDHDADETQSTIYTVKGISDSNNHIEFKVAITGNNSAIITNLPAGNYTVTEETNWSWRYKVDVGKSQTVEVGTDETPTVTFTNKRDKPKWLSGDCYCENWFNPDKIMWLDGEDQIIN